jgi:hypothetical protein
MIELNLTYEESKKILELGYDFTSICRDFELHEKGKITKFVLVERHDCGLVDLWDCDDQEARVYSPKCWWITPLIPKAALLMALPSFERGIVSKDHEHLSFEIGSDFRFAYLKETHSGKTVKNFSSDDENPALIKAFLWVHENYPEELKAKFDEVMN